MQLIIFQYFLKCEENFHVASLAVMCNLQTFFCFNRACEIAKGCRANICTDARSAFEVVHDFEQL